MKQSAETKGFIFLLPTVIAMSVFIGCLALGPMLFNVDGDLGRHLTIGGVILQRGSIPTLDEFSHTMLGLPFSPHEWLAEVFYRLFYNWLGLTGVVMLTATVLSAIFWILTYVLLRNSRSTPITLILIILGVAASRIHWLARPHIFTYLFLILWMEIILSNRKRWVKYVLSGLLMLVWVNTHGAFVIGIVFVGTLLAGEILLVIFKHEWELRKAALVEYLVILGSALFISFINPDGENIWKTIYGFLSSRFLVSHTAEYQPPNLLALGVLPFTLLVAIGLILAVFSFKRVSVGRLLMIPVFALFGIMSGRNIPIFVLVALPVMATSLSSLLPSFRMKIDTNLENSSEQIRQKNRKLPGVWLIATLIAFNLLSLVVFPIVPFVTQRYVFQDNQFPVKAVDWLGEHPQPGKVFNDFKWGGYLLHRLWPETLVFIDGQTDFYGEKLTRDYETISLAFDGYEVLLDSYEIDWIIIPKNSELSKQLIKADSGWVIIYADETANIFRKAIP